MKNLIGNTPLVKINYLYKGIKKYLYAKLEYYNYTGSIKDRVILFILNDAKKRHLLKNGQLIVEATSGNTGISLAALGSLMNHPVHIFMPNWVSKERIKLLKIYGANLHLVSKRDGGFKKAIKLASNYALLNNGFYVDQFNNLNNILAHYKTTGKEITDKLKNIIGFVNGVGTGGTLMGIARRIKKKNKKAKIIAVDPKQMPILSKNVTKGFHHIDGIGDEFIPSILDENIINKIVLIDDRDAINMSRKLACELGLGVGISSGANFLACALQQENGYVTIFADDNKKYLSTLKRKINYSSNKYISNDIKLLDIESID